MGETVLSIGGGDSERWTISETQSSKETYLRKHIFVKPHEIGISTNLVVTTDRRTYHIEIHSLANINYQASVSWRYPSSPIIIANELVISQKEPKTQTPMSGLGQRQLNFNYHFVSSERPAWMPRRAFDDGRKTYVEFPEGMQDIVKSTNDKDQHKDFLSKNKRHAGELRNPSQYMLSEGTLIHAILLSDSMGERLNVFVEQDLHLLPYSG